MIFDVCFLSAVGVFCFGLISSLMFAFACLDHVFRVRRIPDWDVDG